ncbi:hypothetical protein DES38_10285 [Streptohalobacillus salinus]|uniref:Uncharacterized protein n=1 Tax=Streptohalobacillus salinus TaxID=621096 RepID=A0A2V3WGF1_9BACI|nr:hypothetical protein [Streptohalobacillus salinus]PXW92504.1 hypothetical protein DES38_10285 [Streptohalobacillus salinus]
MSWKAVEMQVALPRTQDAGKIQEQMQQRGQFMQNMISKEAKAENAVLEHSVNDLEKDRLLKDKEHKDNQHEHQGDKEQQEKKKQIKQYHPYLGHRVDING